MGTMCSAASHMAVAEWYAAWVTGCILITVTNDQQVCVCFGVLCCDACDACVVCWGVWGVGCERVVCAVVLRPSTASYSLLQHELTPYSFFLLLTP